jgi:prepilin-type N-terminal cleavage/methylation domain-containing protein
MYIIKKTKTFGFSIIELLVVIAILGLLAAIGVPTYQKYSNRAKIASTLAAGYLMVQDAQKYYSQKGVWPSSISVNGVTVPNTGVVTVVNLGSFYAAQYAYNAGSPNNMYFSISVGGLKNISGYVDPAVSETVGSIVVLATRAETNGTFTTQCGQFSASTTYSLPFEYLPNSCNCTEMRSWWLGSANCNT